MARTTVFYLVSTLLVICLLGVLTVVFHSPVEDAVQVSSAGTTVAVRDPRFAEQLATLAGVSLSRGDHYEALIDGDEAFPRMLGAIRGATRRISLQTDSYEAGDIANAFTEALASAAGRGVEVMILTEPTPPDALAEAHLERLSAAGVRIVRTPAWSDGREAQAGGRWLLVIDGETAFTGSIGIADRWRGHAHDPDHWRGLQIRVVGPTAARLEGAFLESWFEAGGRDLPALDAGLDWSEVWTHSMVVRSSPGSGSDTTRLIHRVSIAAAQARITIVSPSLAIDVSLRDALIEALKRGVRVVFLMDAQGRDEVGVGSSAETITELLESGLELHLYQPTRMHARVSVVDAAWVLMGSTGFDLERLRSRPGLLVGVHDPELANRIERQVEADLTRSTLVNLQTWRERRTEHDMLDWLRPSR